MLFHDDLKVIKETDDTWYSFVAHGEGVIGYCIRSEDAKKVVKACNSYDRLISALEFAIKELEGLPRPKGYEFTHLPMVKAELIRAKTGNRKATADFDLPY